MHRDCLPSFLGNQLIELSCIVLRWEREIFG
jgi:hypothetical protein